MTPKTEITGTLHDGRFWRTYDDMHPCCKCRSAHKVYVTATFKDEEYRCGCHNCYRFAYYATTPVRAAELWNEYETATEIARLLSGGRPMRWATYPVVAVSDREWWPKGFDR